MSSCYDSTGHTDYIIVTPSKAEGSPVQESEASALGEKNKRGQGDSAEETVYNIGTWYGGSILTLGTINTTICPGVATLVSKNKDQISIAAQELSPDRSQPMSDELRIRMPLQGPVIGLEDAGTSTLISKRPIGERLNLLDKHRPHTRFFVEGAHDILSYGYTGSSFEQPSTAKDSSSSPLSLGCSSAALGTVLFGSSGGKICHEGVK